MMYEGHAMCSNERLQELIDKLKDSAIEKGGYAYATGYLQVLLNEASNNIEGPRRKMFADMLRDLIDDKKQEEQQ